MNKAKSKKQPCLPAGRKAKSKNFFSLLCLFLCTFILSGCFGSDEVVVDDAGLVKNTGIGYTLRVPASWAAVDASKIVTPTRGKLELAMRSLISKRGFMNNLIILSDDILAETTSAEYVAQSMLWASREYLSTTIESDEVMKFDDGGTSRLVVFRAKYNEVTEEHLFMQTARICGSKVYLMTLGLENDTANESYDRYRPILESFTCK